MRAAILKKSIELAYELIAFMIDRPRRVRRYALTPQKMRSEFDWSLRETSIRQTVEFEGRNWWRDILSSSYSTVDFVTMTVKPFRCGAISSTAEE